VKLVFYLVVMSKRCYSTSQCETSGDLRSLDFERLGGYRYEPKAFVADHARKFCITTLACGLHSRLSGFSDLTLKLVQQVSTNTLFY
jgi:hypothetical protein